MAQSFFYGHLFLFVKANLVGNHRAGGLSTLPTLLFHICSANCRPCLGLVSATSLVAIPNGVTCLVLSLGSLHISPVHTVADRGLDAQPIFLLLPGSVLIFVCWAWVYSFSFTLQTFIIPYPFLPILILKIDNAGESYSEILNNMV
jgi:hypothetical protein